MESHPDPLNFRGEPGWLTRQQIGYILGIGLAQVDRIRVGLNHGFEQREGKSVRIFAPSWLSAHFKRNRTAADPASDADWQEKYWEERVYVLRDARLHRHEQTILRQDVHDLFELVAIRLRGLGHQLQLKYGSEASDMLADTIEDIVRNSEAALAPQQALENKT